MDQELIRAARRTDLGKFLAENHPNDVKIVRTCVYLKAHDSLYTKFGFCGYTRFSSKETGNSIDFLVKYMGYSFQEAVLALTGSGTVVQNNTPAFTETENKTMVVPVPDTPPYRRVFAYLTLSRGIPATIVQRLMREKYLYQEKNTGNAVFINKNRTFCELRGTNTLTKTKFHGIRRATPGCFWSTFSKDSDRFSTAFICEGAIDAISLMILREMEGKKGDELYIGIGGVCNQQIIDWFQPRIHTILAVDNDKAGQKCRDRNPSLDVLIPRGKDWNEDLLCLRAQNIPSIS